MSNAPPQPQVVGEFDYVIIGGGTSGLVLASRLSENKQCHVAVIEAGSNRLDDPRVNIPGMANRTHGTDLDWQFKTSHLNGRQIRQPQGRLLGGSSGINNQAFIAPSAAGIDAWETMGNDGWNWGKLAPYYRKFHTLEVPDKATAEHLGLQHLETDLDSGRGPIQASYTGTIQNPLAKAWVDTFKKFNFSVNSNPFSGKSLGGYANPSTVDPRTKTRSYAASAYFEPAMERSNLNTFTEAVVQRLVFSDVQNATDNAIADKVVFISHGTIKCVKVRKEVILAAGVIGSPKILELSGIGSTKILEAHSIPVVHSNENVGENLQDHLMTGISFEVRSEVRTLDALVRQEPMAVETAMRQYGEEKAGPLAVGGIGSHAIMPLMSSGITTSDYTELKRLIELYEPQDAKAKAHYNIVREIFQAPGEATGAFFLMPVQWPLHGPTIHHENYLSLGTNQCHPLSRGSVHITSSDPIDPPIINPQYLSSELDLELMARQVMFLQVLAFTPPLSDFLKPDGMRNHPSAHIKSIEEAKEYVRATAISNYHPCGSCAMLPEERGGVVSNRLLVYGTRNVRVVDASIFPIIPRGNIQSTVYAVAERAADIIQGKDIK
ncbi:MAG: hypothetical protein Q9227_003141 [Pyrenula ochraceoflavens]